MPLCPMAVGADMFAGNLADRTIVKPLQDLPKWLLSCIDVLAGSDLPAGDSLADSCTLCV